MGNWWKITLLEIRLALKDREAVAWSFIAPLVMAWLFGTMFAPSDPRPTGVSIDPGDNPAYVGDLVGGMLEGQGLVLSTSESVARVVLPDSLIPGLLAGADVSARVLKRNASDLRAQQVAARTREVLYTLAFRAREDWVRNPPDSARVAELVATRGPMSIETAPLGKPPRAVGGIPHQLPAMLVMFLLLNLTTYFLIQWVEDVGSGKIRRIVMSPTRTRDLFAAQLASRFLWGVVQVAIILGVGTLVLGVELDVPAFPFAVVILAYMVTAIALGLLLATFFRSAEKANAVGVIVALSMAALGGCWWPLETVTSPAMRAVALALPTGLTMDALEEFMALGPDAPFPLTNVVALVAMSAVMMPLAIRRMRRQITG